VEYKPKQYLTLQEFNTGLGLLQAVPGPTFTIATFANGIAMRKLGYGINGQLIGCLVGTLAIFLPGTLLIFFVYPFWNELKTYPIVYRSLDGIISVSIGFLWSAAIFMLKPYFVTPRLFADSDQWQALLIFGITLLYLRNRKLPAFLLVIVTILAGYLF
ncbi:MAG: chromate transporter, partial [Bacteroidia bacterium]|nr:chromate transporter [Bacteroidia bacterium]